MTINYACFGRSDDVRERRYTVLVFFLKGAKPAEIAEKAGIPIRTVYNDILFLPTNPLHDLPIEMVRDMGKTFYELKISELERSLKKHESNGAVWLGIQKLIKDYKDQSLKLQGVMVDKIEHSGFVVTIHQEIITDPTVQAAANELAERMAKASQIQKSQ